MFNPRADFTIDDEGFFRACVAPIIAIIADIILMVIACSPVDAFLACLATIAWMAYDVPLEAYTFACDCWGSGSCM